MLVSMSSVVLLCLAMLPTLAAFIIDKTPQKYFGFCVGGMNLSGTFPSLMDLWAGVHDVDQAMDILSNVFSLAIIYGAAAFGWMVYIIVPPVVAAFLTMIAKRRAQQLRSVQSQLVEEWGEVLARSSGDRATTTPGA